ncbi:MAG: CaiB/BaiF CoA transferase family protein [Armatimonadota bacterium]
MTTPLQGVRILDFGHVVTGPFATGLLAEFGADVIKVESATAVEAGRRLGPFRPDGPRDPEGSALFAGLNRQKRSVAINLKHPHGADVARALAARCDAVTENFSAGVMDRLGLGHDQLLAINPRLIYVSMSGLGYGGPRSGWASFNAVIQALSGLMLTTGSPGEPPTGVSNSWADFMAGLHAALVLVSALERRDRTGQGCWIDVSQYEANALPLGHLMLNGPSNGTRHAPGARPGNRAADRVPQGCYRCRGEDAWCVISIGSGGEWEALVGAVGDETLRNPRYATAEGRLQALEEIDSRLEGWTRQRASRDVEAQLQAAGAPAAAVRTNVEALADLPVFAPSVRTMRHPVIGAMPALPNPIHLDADTVWPDRAGPRLGEHTDAVLREVLALEDAEITRLHAEGVLV